MFTVVTSEKVAINQLVALELGYAHQDALQRVFIGFVEKVTPVGTQRAKLVCRELSAALFNRLPLDLRHVSGREVLARINELTGLNFATPNEKYATKKVANFFNLGNGYQAMNMIGRVFNVPDYIWQQQGNGVIYVGSWAQSRWAKLKNLVLPEKLFDQQEASNSAQVATIPQLRPGMRVNGHRITQITFKGNNMVLAWNK